MPFPFAGKAVDVGIVHSKFADAREDAVWHSRAARVKLQQAVTTVSAEESGVCTRTWTRFPQLVTNVVVREKRPFDQLDGVLQLVSQAEANVKPDGGRVLLRYSGTEPKARLLIEGRDEATLQHWSKQICELIRKHVGAESGNGH